MNQARPNILFVFPDQWRRQAVGFRNEEPVHTPHIDQFARESLSLNNAISCFPLCSPNRSVMLTGRYPLSTGVTANCKIGLEVKMNNDEVTIGNVLQREGYQTGYIGKWHLDLPEQQREPEPASGARHWDAYIPPGPRRFGFDYWYAYNAYDHHLSPHYWKDTAEMIQPDEWSTKHETDAAIQFIRNRDQDRPFCLFVSWNPPHQPFEEVPERFKAEYADKPIVLRPNVIGEGITQANQHLHDYYAAVNATDEQFGRLMSMLDSEGLREDTIVVLTSDHGETMGAHGWLEHKNIWYEESIGVPMLIRYPRVIEPREESLLFNSSDIVPTLLGLLGIPVLDRMQGTDFASIFSGKGGVAEASSAFICHYPGGILEHEQAKERGLNINAYGWRGIRTQRYTYVAKRELHEHTVTRLCYDNEQDPHQLSPKQWNQSPQDEVGRQLEAELEQWLNRLNDPFLLKE